MVNHVSSGQSTGGIRTSVRITQRSEREGGKGRQTGNVWNSRNEGDANRPPESESVEGNVSP